MFPFTGKCSSGIKSLTEADKIKALAFLKEYVENYKAKDIVIAESTLAFKMDFYGARGGKFNGIDKGEFILDGSKIIFKFQMYGLLIVLFAVIACMIITSRYADIATISLVIISGNWVIVFYRYRSMTAQLAEKVNML